ncbi:MAG: phosphogluconate dehydratase [Chromatocurvus sp.]
MNPIVEQVTISLRKRSRKSRGDYLDNCQRTRDELPPRKRLSCGNLAHGYAACSQDEKAVMARMESANIGVINAYNDMLSAHQPLHAYPDLIKQAAWAQGATAQVASGVPAMCDGVTQGQPGMELSLFSRDVVAMATAVGLSHNLFDAAVCLGICDKIVPGMLIGALQFAHLPIAFIGSGPMASGIPNREKAAVRQRHAQGEADDAELLAVESASYHSPGTCTFYGTANSNQMLMEMLGVQLPGSSFLHPEDPLRPALLDKTVAALIRAAEAGPGHTPLYRMVDESSIVNAVVGLLATGGSTNHTLHLVAIARSAGIQLSLDDFHALSPAVPLLTRIYPNGSADINDFQRAGGMACLADTLRRGGLLNEDVVTLLGPGLDALCRPPTLGENGDVTWTGDAVVSADTSVLATLSSPFAAEGGLRRLRGNLGECVIKVSAVDPEHYRISAPARVFSSQQALRDAFDANELDADMIAVVRFQGPVANGMPELHKLTPYLGVLQDRGHRVALVTDGRMSGASGKVPAAIHLTPEAGAGGMLARVRNGDIITLDAEAGTLELHVEASDLAAREAAQPPSATSSLGRGLFGVMRSRVSDSASGACVFQFPDG